MKKALLIGLIFLLVLTGCAANISESRDGNHQDPETIVRMKYGDSIVDYLYNINKENIIISNVSINMALAMLLEGTNGNTQKQLEEYLGFSKDEARQICRQLMDGLKQYSNKQTEQRSDGEKHQTGLGFVEIANSLWFNNGAIIKEEYRKLLKDFFDATAESLDFLDPKSADIINNWVSKKTKGLINEIVKPDQLAELYMILINALYMKGAWQEKYGNVETGLFNGKETDVLKSTEKVYYENDKAVGFGKYINGGFEMIAILPKQEGEFTLADMDIDGLLKTESFDYDVTATIPKFDVGYSANLTDVLKAMGIKDAFDPAVSDLSDIRDITGEDRLYVSDVVHKTHVKVDENGFEGAAVTAIMVKNTALPTEKVRKEVTIDRPFVFIIMDLNTKTAVFTGKIITLDK